MCNTILVQLGEILKAYGHFQEAALHLRHVLELRPNHEPALAILKEMEAAPDSTVHVYTLLIIGRSCPFGGCGWGISVFPAENTCIDDLSNLVLTHRKGVLGIW